MSPREKSFRRKIVYLVVITLLLIPLFLLGNPAGSDAEKTEGGILAQLRADPEYGLSQKHLGQIDATSETIKLATLGLRGVAANLLWGKAHLYKKKKDWTNLKATVLQITKLQPNFISVWIFQGWNLSYNVSAEFDDYRERYRYVIEGIDFLKEGVQYNDREPRLCWEVGWALSQKIGRADESKQFRLLFKQDRDFHLLPDGTYRPEPLRDNWLVGKSWYIKATDLVDREGVTMTGKGPLIYRSSSPMCQMNYADALQVDGRFDERTQQAWQDAVREWQQYGSIDIPTSQIGPDGLPVVIQLNDLDRGKDYQGQIDAITQKLNGLVPDLREKIKEAKEAKLTDQQREARGTAPLARTAGQRVLAEKAEEQLEVTDEDVVRWISDPKNRIDPEKRRTAVQLWRGRRNAEAMAGVIRRYRDIVNFDYWRLRAEVERTDDAVDAHEAIYQGDREREDADLAAARQHYEKGLAAWRKVLDKYPEAVTDMTFGSDLMEVIQRYRELLDRLDDKPRRDATYGKDFILHDVVELHQEEGAGSAP